MKPEPRLYRRENGYWYIRFYESEYSRSPSRLSLNTKDKAAAQSRFAAWKRKFGEDSRVGIRARSVTLADAAQKYLEHLSARGAESTVTRYRTALGNMISGIGEDMLLAELRPSELMDYQAVRASTAAKRTVDLEMEVMGFFLNWAKKRGWVLENWASTHHVPRMESARQKRARQKNRNPVFTDEELEKLLEPTGRLAFFKPHFNMLYWLGLRISELGHLQDQDVDLGKGTVTIRPKKLTVPKFDRHLMRWGREEKRWALKTYLRREVPIPEALAEVLWQYEKEKTPNIHRLYVLMPSGALVTDHLGRYARQASGNKKASCHWFRHTYVTHMLNRYKIPVQMVQQMVGHANLQTTMGYLHTDLQDLMREVGRIGRNEVDGR